MAQITKITLPTISTFAGVPYNDKVTGLMAGEGIAAGDFVYLNADGLVYRTNGVAADALALTLGLAAGQAVAGGPVTVFQNVNLHYGEGLTPGARLFLSDSVLGGLADVATLGSPVGSPVAVVLDKQRIKVLAISR